MEAIISSLFIDFRTLKLLIVGNFQVILWLYISAGSSFYNLVTSNTVSGNVFIFDPYS